MDVATFIHETCWEDLPESVRSQARRCLLDTIGAAIGGRETLLAQIIHDFAAAAYGGEGATLWLDGRQVSPPGAALANGMTIDSLDIHDGYAPVKGHAGAAVVPAALASLSLDPAGRVDGRELLTTLVVGYEVALRAGLALHATACDYHTSGAWNALGCAAMVARRLKLGGEKTRHALGIAEYHGPRSQMMRDIDYPTMVKDGSGWGAMAGVSAAQMAAGGFSGAPALTVESSEVAPYWTDLGARWLINDQYFKPYAVCRWAQPAIVAALTVMQAHDIPVENIERIQVHSFHEAIRLAVCRPETTEEAQYSLPFPVAAALLHDRLGPAELSGAALRDPRVLALSERIELLEEPEFNAPFPEKRLARLIIEDTGGNSFDSGIVEASWGEDDPPSDAELREKYRWLAGRQLPEARSAELESLIWGCSDLPDATVLSRQLATQ
jgi:2-methylcitrate dehydratase PrpD